MLLGLRTVVYPVSDMSTAKAFYTTLTGKTPYFDEPYYAGYNLGGYELGLIPDAGASVVTYWGVADIEAAHKELVQRGALPDGEIQDVGDGIRTAHLRDGFGNTIGIIENPHFKLAP